MAELNAEGQKVFTCDTGRFTIQVIMDADAVPDGTKMFLEQVGSKEAYEKAVWDIVGVNERGGFRCTQFPKFSYQGAIIEPTEPFVVGIVNNSESFLMYNDDKVRSEIIIFDVTDAKAPKVVESMMPNDRTVVFQMEKPFECAVFLHNVVLKK